MMDDMMDVQGNQKVVKSSNTWLAIAPAISRAGGKKTISGRHRSLLPVKPLGMVDAKRRHS
jgi:hypothetical protein